MDQNKHIWNQAAYDAWITRFGTPETYAKKLTENPEKILQGLIEHMDHVQGKTLLNLMGSNGNKAVSFALLGAEVTVVDFSVENEKYATALSESANVSIQYIVDDVLNTCEHSLPPQDWVIAEMGILHYFQDLGPFFKVIQSALKVGGRAIIRDFHPISTKLIESRGTTAKVRKHKITGDYFSEALVAQEVSYGKYLNGLSEGIMTVLLRKWTLGEVVTAAAQSGLVVLALFEYPNQSSEVFDAGIPKTFTLILENRG